MELPIRIKNTKICKSFRKLFMNEFSPLRILKLHYATSSYTIIKNKKKKYQQLILTLEASTFVACERRITRGDRTRRALENRSLVILALLSMRLPRALFCILTSGRLFFFFLFSSLRSASVGRAISRAGARDDAAVFRVECRERERDELLSRVYWKFRESCVWII